MHPKPTSNPKPLSTKDLVAWSLLVHTPGDKHPVHLNGMGGHNR